jgi:Holliday junction resolvase RusA-like endonuclease
MNFSTALALSLFDEEVVFFVSGDPVPKARPRFMVRGGKVTTYTPKESARWERTITLVATAVRSRGEVPWPIRAKGRYKLSIVVATSKRGRRRGDLDNHAKACADAVNGILWDDDASVEHLDAQFQHVSEDECGVWIRVRKLA